MSSFHRQQVSTIVSRLGEAPETLIIVSGPRQAGKTTLVRQALDQVDMEHRYLLVDEPELPTPSLPYDEHEAVAAVAETRDTQWLVRAWEKARKDAERSKHGFVLLLDEIQKIPQWSETVKGLWDADRAAKCPLHVVVLGSAPLLMQQGLTESLAGRFELIRVTHWSFPEMYEAFGFDLPSYIYFGGYPGAAQRIHDQSRWREYVRSSLIEPNIERDILSMTRVKKPALLKQAFELACQTIIHEHNREHIDATRSQPPNVDQQLDAVSFLCAVQLIAGRAGYALTRNMANSAFPALEELDFANHDLLRLYPGFPTAELE